MSRRFKARPSGIRVRRRSESQMDYDLRRAVEASITNQRELEVYIARLGEKITDRDERERFQRACLVRIIGWLKFKPVLPLSIWQPADGEVAPQP